MAPDYAFERAMMSCLNHRRGDAAAQRERYLAPGTST